MIELWRYNRIYNSWTLVSKFDSIEKAVSKKTALELIDSGDSWSRFAHSYAIRNI